MAFGGRRRQRSRVQVRGCGCCLPIPIGVLALGTFAARAALQRVGSR